MLEIDLPEKLEQGLIKASEQMGISVEECLQKAIAEYLEDQQDIRIAKERLANPGKRYSSEEVDALLSSPR